MKKVFALLLSLGAMTAVFAQHGRSRNESRDVIVGKQDRTVYDNDRRNDNGYYSTRERDARIERIYREYNWKIEKVRESRQLRNAEKKRRIRSLQNERDEKIRYIRERYSDRNSRGNNRRY